MTNVIHLNTIAGKAVGTLFDENGKPVSMLIGDFMKSAIDRIVATGDGWPHDAVYKVEYKCSTWPMGWEKETSVEYFSSKEELDVFIGDYVDWAKSEDNRFHVIIHEWDLGPSIIEDKIYGS